MVTEDEGRMVCGHHGHDDDSDPGRFSFSPCGFVCTTTPAAHPNDHDPPNDTENHHENENDSENIHTQEEEEDRAHREKHIAYRGGSAQTVYPSPPPTADEPKRSVPLPGQQRSYECGGVLDSMGDKRGAVLGPQQQQQRSHEYGGILDSPVVLIRASPPMRDSPGVLTMPMRGGTPTPLSPPPTIPTPTHALPPADSSALQAILEGEHDEYEHEGEGEGEGEKPQPTQLLSPISPEWTTHRPSGVDVEAEDADAEACVLMAQPRYAPPAAPADEEGDSDILGGAERPALRRLAIPFYITHEPPQMPDGGLLGFAGPGAQSEADAVQRGFPEVMADATAPYTNYERQLDVDPDAMDMQDPPRLLGFPGTQMQVIRSGEDDGGMYDDDDDAPLPLAIARHARDRHHEDARAHHDLGTGALLGFPGAQMIGEDADAGLDEDPNVGTAYDATPLPLHMSRHHHHHQDMDIGAGVLLGFPGTQMLDGEDEDKAYAPSHLGFAPPHPGFAPHPPSPFSSPASSLRELDDLDFDSDMDTDVYSYPGSDSDSELELDDTDMASSHSPSPLRSFASLPSPDLDDLDIDMDLGPTASPSPSRRSAAPLPAFDDPPFASPFFPHVDPAYVDADAAAPPPDPANALLLDLPPAPAPAPPPSPLDALSPAALAARLPPGYPPAELAALLAVRRRAAAALARALADGAPASSRSTEYDYELRTHVPRDAGEPRRRRKRAKEVGREVDALVGLVVGLGPAASCSAASAVSTSASAAASTACPSSMASADADPERRQQEKKEKKRSTAKAGLGLAGLASVPALVARMILRRRERCVRGLGEGRGRGQGRPSPLRLALDAEGEEGGEPPPMEVESDY